MEEFDVVNHEDEIIGKATRDECHANPSIIHRALHFTLINPETKEILLTRRARNLKYDGGKLCFLGEHVKAGESWEDALRRGVKEELGFDPTTWKEIDHYIFSYATQTEFVRFFLVDWNYEKIELEKDEIEESMWLSKSELEQISSQTSHMTNHWVKKLMST